VKGIRRDCLALPACPIEQILHFTREDQTLVILNAVKNLSVPADALKIMKLPGKILRYTQDDSMFVILNEVKNLKSGRKRIANRYPY